MTPLELVKRVKGLGNHSEVFAKLALAEAHGDMLDAASMLVWAASIVLNDGKTGGDYGKPRGYDPQSKKVVETMKAISHIVEEGPKFASLFLLIMSTRIFYLNDVEIKKDPLVVEGIEDLEDNDEHRPKGTA